MSGGDRNTGVAQSRHRRVDPEMRIDRAAKLFAQRVQGSAVLDTLGPEPDVEPLEHRLCSIVLMVDSRPRRQRRLDHKAGLSCGFKLAQFLRQQRIDLYLRRALFALETPVLG